MEPHPSGTLVRCFGSHGLPLKTSCKEHIFEVGESKKVEDYTESGYIQIAKCLVCSYTTPPVDADFFRIEADGMDLAALSGELHEAIEHFKATLDYIGKKMTGELPLVQVMRDFG